MLEYIQLNMGIIKWRVFDSGDAARTLEYTFD